MICVRCHATALESTGDIRAPSPSNCREALVRRQVLIEKGMLPADYPIPAHLQHGIPKSLEGLAGDHAAAARFIPLNTIHARLAPVPLNVAVAT